MPVLNTTWRSLTLAVVGFWAVLVTSAKIPLSSLLQVESKIAPVGIDVKPRFSWGIRSTQRGFTQTSYHILVSKSQAGDSDVWNSGIVRSSKSHLVEYFGPTLTSNTHYFWTVNVITPAGRGSASSEFTTGILISEDWSSSLSIAARDDERLPAALVTAFRAASWIWTFETGTPLENGVPDSPAGSRGFRKAFTPPSDKVATSAIILLTVDDRFSFYVNGNLVGSSPETGDAWKVARTFSVILTPGPTLFAIQAINLPNPSLAGAGGAAGVLAAIQIIFSDGTTSLLVSDSTWLTTKNITTGFESPSFDDSQWANATILAKYGQGIWASNVEIPLEATSTVVLHGASEITSPTAPASATPSTDISASRTSKQVGAIVGGVVGGVIALLATALIVLWRKKRSTQSAPPSLDFEPFTLPAGSGMIQHRPSGSVPLSSASRSAFVPSAANIGAIHKDRGPYELEGRLRRLEELVLQLDREIASGGGDSSRAAVLRGRVAELRRQDSSAVVLGVGGGSLHDSEARSVAPPAYELSRDQ